MGNEKVSINGIAWIPETVRGVVVIVHGMAEYANRYDRFARFLCEKGYAVYANDHRGHGYTLNDSKIGFFAKKDGWELVLSDLNKVVTMVRDHHGELPLTLFGHSMGSLLARHYAMDYGRKIDRLILSGTLFDKGLLSSIGLVVAKVLSRLVRPHTPSILLSYLTFAGVNQRIENRRTKFDFLSRDASEVDKYLNDPLCGFVCSNAFFVDLLTGLKYVHTMENVRRTPSQLPILLLSGDHDPIGDYGKGVEKVYRQLTDSGCTQVTLKLYPQARHELVNETNREQVYQDIVEWMGA